MTSLVAQMVKCLPTMQETQVQSLGWDDLLEKEMAIHSSILPGKSHGRRIMVGYTEKTRMRENVEIHGAKMWKEKERVLYLNTH